MFSDSSRARIIWFGSVLGLFLLALIAGGTARYGSPFNIVLELLSLPVVLAALFLLLDQPLTPPIKAALLLCAGILLLPLLQLVPLPPMVWTALPGRSFVTDVLTAASLTAPWMPLSLSPPATLRSFLSLFPPLAIFLATLTMRQSERRLITLALIGFGILCVPFGLAQIALGPDSGLRPYAVTNVSSAVGFFANRNHYAALLYVVIPFIAAWMIHRIRSRGKERFGWIALIVAAYGILILGLGIAASRAGLALAMVAILAGVFLAWRSRKTDVRTNPAPRIVFIASVLGVFVMLQFGLASIMGRLGHDPLEDARVTLAHVTWRAATSVLPVGSGMGTFVPYYAMFELPPEMSYSYANHAHNDWLELWLEAGVPGMILALAFLCWFAAATYQSWRLSDARLDGLLAQAASIAAMLLMAHSFVDYPLRTTALACLFAFCCAMITRTAEQEERDYSIPTSKPRSGAKMKHRAGSSRGSVAKSPQLRRNRSWTN